MWIVLPAHVAMIRPDSGFRNQESARSYALWFAFDDDDDVRTPCVLLSYGPLRLLSRIAAWGWKVGGMGDFEMDWLRFCLRCLVVGWISQKCIPRSYRTVICLTKRNNNYKNIL